MKKIGYLSFGHYQDVPGSTVRDAREQLHQAIELAVEAEKIGVAGAFFRVHHFAPQHAAPIPLLAAIASRTSTIELGTGVIDMRYENPLYLAEEAAVADLISNGRLQLGISRGSPEPANRGFEAFGYQTPEGLSDVDMVRHKAELFRAAIQGAGVVRADPAMTGHDHPLAIDPQSPGLIDRIWWGAGSSSSSTWVAEQGYNLMSSTLLLGATGKPFDELQAEQIREFRTAWAEAGHERTPRVSVTRSIVPLVSDADRRFFGLRGQAEGDDQVGHIDGSIATFGKSYIGEPEDLIEQLAADQAIQEADTLMVAIPSQLGVEFNLALMDNIVNGLGPELGWK